MAGPISPTTPLLTRTNRITAAATRNRSRCATSHIGCEALEEARRPHTSSQVRRGLIEEPGVSLTRGNFLLLGFFRARQLNSELLAFFVQMASLQPQCFGGVGDVVLLPLELLENNFSLDLIDALGQCAMLQRRRSCFRGGRERQRQSHRGCIHCVA